MYLDQCAAEVYTWRRALRVSLSLSQTVWRLHSRRCENMVGVNMVLTFYSVLGGLYARTVFPPTMFSRGRHSGFPANLKTPFSTRRKSEADSL